MQEPVKAEPVVSGAPYVVVAVNGRQPVSLEDFVAAPVIDLELARADESVSLSGSSNLDDAHVVFHEKAEKGVGKDIRTWEIQECVDHFEAATRSAF